MTDEEIVKVVNTLVGYIYPIADSSYDRKVCNNIATMGSVIDTLVCNIGNMICDKKDSYFASVEECTKRATDILKTIRSNIDEYLSEVE
jgi:hypothetical protein